MTGYTDVVSRAALDYDASLLSIFHSFNSYESSAFSQELQLDAKLFDDRLNIVGGLFYYKEQYYKDRLITNTFVRWRGDVPGTTDGRDTTTIAAFVDSTFGVTDKLSLIFGGRLSRDEKKVTAVRATTGAQLAQRSGSWDSAIGRVGLQYQWDPHIMTYATISQGFRGGGFNLATPTGQPPQYFEFKPEKSVSYEVGARLDLFDRRVRFNPTFFYNNWTDIQVQSVDNATLAIVLGNAAKAHTYGFELEAQAAITDNLQLFGTLATLEAKYDSIGNATGITLNSKFMRAPKLTYSVGATYDQKIFGGIGAVATVNYAWAAQQNSTPTDTDFMLLPSYGVLNARLDISDPASRYTVSLFATNLTDQVYYIGGVQFSKNVGVDRVDLGRPREFGVSLRAKF